MVKGKVVSQSNSGFSIVILDDGRESVFGRFDTLGSSARIKGSVKLNSRIQAEIKEQKNDIIHLFKVERIHPVFSKRIKQYITKIFY